ncbi:MAG: YraN family protein [Dehalococcoidia bacterium]
MTEQAPNRSTKAGGTSGPRQQLGAFGEGMAAAYIARRGYRVVARNVRFRVGEIDLVAIKDGMTVFVEVRSRRDDADGAALESISRRKQHRMRAAAELYLALHPDVPPEGRIDVVAVTLARDGTVRMIELVENAVEG